MDGKDKKLQAAFAKILRENRENAGLTQEELAFECEIDRSYVSVLERGLRMPSLSIFFKLCQGLQVTPTQIISAIEKKLT